VGVITINTQLLFNKDSRQMK